MTDYFVEGGDVLENKLGITDPEQLREAEEDAFSDTAADILNEDLSDAILDFNFFKQLHGRLFGKVYPFAVQIRTVNIRNKTVAFHSVMQTSLNQKQIESSKTWKQRTISKTKPKQNS